MGCTSNIDIDHFPTQGCLLGRDVRVCFGFDTSRTLEGKVVRNDVEAPGLTIIRLSDGRHILSTECQFQPLKLSVKPLEWPAKRPDGE